MELTLSPEEAGLASLSLDRLRRSGLEGAVTGGLAIAWHRSRGTGVIPVRRPLHDLDLVVKDIESIPDRLGETFAIRHVHADAPPGRMLVQACDRSTNLRIDIFGAYGDTLSRCLDAALRGTSLKVVSLEDVVARLGSLLLDLALDEKVAPKHAHDFSALVAMVDATMMAVSWKAHRRKHHPPGFNEARSVILDLVRNRPDLLMDPGDLYGVFPCQRCRPKGALIPAARVSGR